MTTRRRWVTLGLVLLIAAAAGVGFALRLPPRPETPSVLLITLDTTRSDHLRPFGYFRETTPNLDALAARSSAYLDAWAPMATTLPSHTSLLTGAWPLEHGVLSNVAHGGRRTLPTDALVPASELFRRAGYRTGAFVSATPLMQGTGIERGFDDFDQPPRHVRHARATTEAALGWLKQHGAEPFFLWVHYYDAHGPFDPPAEFRKFDADQGLTDWMDELGIPWEAMRAGGAELDPVQAHDDYDGELLGMDHEIGRLLESLRRKGWADRTVVVVVGDHGEGLGQHEVAGHGQVWREQLQVPLIVHVPWERGERISAPISMVDVMPTVVDLVGVPGGAEWIAATSGRDVRKQPSGPILGITSLRQENLIGTPPQRALTAGTWRYLDLGQGPVLFDLRTDPHERADLAAVLPFHREVLRRWTDRLHDEEQARGVALGTGATVDVPDDEVRSLEQLGYLDE